MSKVFEITVSPKGATKIETKGFAGSECMQASRFLEQALGKSTGVVVTSEFHQERTNTEATCNNQPR